MTFAIRTATPADLPRLDPLFEELDEHHRRARPDLFQRPDGPRRDPEMLARFAAGPDSVILVADGLGGTRTDGDLLGLATVFVRPSYASEVMRPRPEGEMDNLVVMPAARRRGVGEALMAAAEDWVRAKGVTRLIVNVYAFNAAAVGFYQTAGFTPEVLHMVRALD